MTLSKVAVILVGHHHFGKSATIRDHLKPLLKIGKDDHIFSINGKDGWIYSQSLQEKDEDDISALEDSIERHNNKSILLLASRMEDATAPSLSLIINTLYQSGYEVVITTLYKKKDTNLEKSKAKELYDIISHYSLSL